MKYNYQQIKQKYMDRYGLSEIEANQKLIFYKHNGKLLIGMEFYNIAFQDRNFYLFDADKIDDLYNSPIAQIKFMDDDQNDMFIRRLEFVDNSYKGKGYASALIKCFELYTKNNGFSNIVGELVPLHDEPASKVKKFYIKNGFKIVMDNNNEPHIFKKLEKIETKINCGVQTIDTEKSDEMEM